MKKEIKKDNKKQEKSLLFCKILTVFSIGLSLLSILVGCSALNNQSKQKDQIEKVSETKSAFDISNNFIYTDNYAYGIEKNGNYYNGFLSLERYFINDNSIYLIIEATSNTKTIYKVKDLTAYSDYALLSVINEDDDIYNVNLNYSNITNSYNTLIKFNQKLSYRFDISNLFNYVYRVYNYNDNTTSYYSELLEYALQGAFHLENTNDILIYDMRGYLNYYNNDNSYVEQYFDKYVIDYSNGIYFANQYGYFDIYTSLSYGDNKVFRLKNMDTQEGSIVKVSKLYLLENELKKLPSIFIDLSKQYRKTYNLKDLYYSEFAFASGGNFDNEYYFRFNSYGYQFLRFEREYRIYNNPFYFENRIRYINSVDNLLVLDARGVPDVNGIIGNANGIDYDFPVMLNGYQTFTIYDTYSFDIQLFQMRETYSSPLFDNVSFEDSDLFDAFDLISGVFTSLLPFLNFAILPNLTIGVLVMVPFAISLILFVINIFKR